MFFSEKFEQAPRNNGGQRSLHVQSPWGQKESGTQLSDRKASEIIYSL